MMNGYRLWCGRFRTLKPKLKARLMRLIPLPVKMTTAGAADTQLRDGDYVFVMLRSQPFRSM